MFARRLIKTKLSEMNCYHFISPLNSDLAKEASCFLYTRIITQKEEKVNQNASKSACPATSDQLGRIAADLNGNSLDSVCHADHLPFAWV